MFQQEKANYTEEKTETLRKMNKNRVFGYGNLTTCRKSHFSSVNIESKYNKVYIAKNKSQTASINVLILYRRRLW